MIKNKGITETIINDNNQLHINKTNWDANYDGNTANILVDTSTNGKHNVYAIQLDNEDLASLLNVPSDNITLEKRLIRDFKRKNKIHNRTPTPYRIEFDENNNMTTLPHTHISSPLPNENLVISSPYKKSNSNSSKSKRRHSTRHKSHTKKSHTNKTHSNKSHTNKTHSNKSHKTYKIIRRTI